VTIDELARRAGETSRNVRAYQARGLLPRPRLAGRTGIYDDRHLERLSTIRRLQDRGFSLAAIGELLDARDHGATLADVLGPAPATGSAEREATVFERADVPAVLRLALVPEPLARRLAG
jgi:DNA-binding transcriptional MerR regulator